MGEGGLLEEGEQRDDKRDLPGGNSQHPAQKIVLQFRQADIKMFLGDQLSTRSRKASVCTLAWASGTPAAFSLLQLRDNHFQGECSQKAKDEIRIRRFGQVWPILQRKG